MSEVNQKLKKASYRGINFFYQSSNETGGFKFAEHQYPGSDNFNIEQLGRRPRRFSIEAKVDFDSRDSFRIALNTPESGIFAHPMYGNFLVKVTDFSLSDSKDVLGFYTFTVEFVVELGLQIPSLSTIGTAVISRLRSALVTSAGALLKKSLKRIGF